ncbi:MAG: ASCH domain-containing protein [Dechloromonas sp.]|nr:ASCH domain-containing protein [Dechloromonas sp.]
MKTLAVRQPWANHIAEGWKPIEVRSWRTDYRGPLLIVASGKPCIIDREDGSESLLPTQRQVCVVDLVDVHPWLRHEAEAACLAAEDWDAGFFGWHVANPRHVWPAAHKGKLNLYQTDDAGIYYLPPGVHNLDAPPPTYCARCGHPPGPDWLDEAATCPRCRLVQKG